MPVAKSKIEWTDSTWSPVTGCTKVSPGCKFCYAERVTERFGRGKFTDVQLHPDRLDAPLRWRRPRRVFVNSMSDLFHKAVPDEFLDRVFAVMALCPQHTFQVLTKRPERMRSWFARDEKADALVAWQMGLMVAEKDWAHGHEIANSFRRGGWPLPNVWLGVSVEDQARADERIPLLLQTPAVIRFLSVEPLLGPVAFPLPCQESVFWGGIRWVIVGGESGGPPERALIYRATNGGRWSYGVKPEALTWVRSLRDQTTLAGVPFFFKQWGGVTPKAGGRLLDDRMWDEYPRRVT